MQEELLENLLQTNSVYVMLKNIHIYAYVSYNNIFMLSGAESLSISSFGSHSSLCQVYEYTNMLTGMLYMKDLLSDLF